MTDRAQHWDTAYAEKVDDVSWFEEDASSSWSLMERLALPPSTSVIDVGAGNSRLVERLLGAGVADVTLLDLSAAALEQTMSRLPAGRTVETVIDDVLTWKPSRSFDVWHDRAVFHFLTDPADRSRYRETLGSAVAPGGTVVIGTFGANGPEQCSGLPVSRYTPDELAHEIGDGYTVSSTTVVDHVTPWGAVQSFSWVIAVRNS